MTTTNPSKRRDIGPYDVIQIKSRQDDRWEDLMTLRTPEEIADAKRAVVSGWTGACGHAHYRIRAGSACEGVLYDRERALSVEETVEMVSCLLDGKTPKGWEERPAEAVAEAAQKLEMGAQFLLDRSKANEALRLALVRFLEDDAVTGEWRKMAAAIPEAVRSEIPYLGEACEGAGL